jgi:hypothetical protein
MPMRRANGGKKQPNGARRQAVVARSRDDVDIMTRQAQIIQPIPHLPVSRRGMKRWWISAIVYLTLCLWLGPHVAFWLTVIGGWTIFWFYLCGRFPFLSLFTVACLTGFVGGLMGSRGGGYYGYSYYGPRYRRR